MHKYRISCNPSFLYLESYKFWKKIGYFGKWDNRLIMAYDEAVNLTSEKHDPCAQTSHLHKRRKQEYLAEGTSVEPVKYPPKVKLEIFLQL